MHKHVKINLAFQINLYLFHKFFFHFLIPRPVLYVQFKFLFPVFLHMANKSKNYSISSKTEKFILSMGLFLGKSIFVFLNYFFKINDLENNIKRHIRSLSTPNGLINFYSLSQQCLHH